MARNASKTAPRRKGRRAIAKSAPRNAAPNPAPKAANAVKSVKAAKAAKVVKAAPNAARRRAAEADPRDPRAALRPRPPGDAAGLSRAQLLEIYGLLFETRRLEEHLVALYRQSQVVGGVYRSLGQEGTAVGCTYALREGDIIQPLIRDLGAMLVHGVTPLALLRQYMARGAGPSGGRDLNQHFSDPERGLLGPVSMLGAMVPVLAGCLLAARMRGQPHRVGLSFIGDGGSSTGAFYEGFNFAAVQRLPLIVVMEANGYAYSTPTEMQVPGGDLVQRARGYGVPVETVDGNDVLACYAAVRDARARAVEGGGPTVIVAHTYRRRGHAEHDNQGYVPAGEPDAWAQHNDPVDRYVRFLQDGGHAGEDDLRAVRDRIEGALEEARTTAVADGFPDPSTLLHGVFDDGTRPWPGSDTWWRGGPPNRE